MVDPNDLKLQARVQRAFWIKLQINDVLSPVSNYRFLAIQVLEIARDKGYDINKLEAACKRFESSQQFGDRIETSKFFENDTEQLHPASWKNEQFLKNSTLQFDAYRVDGFDLPQWRIHDGKKLDGLDCVVWANKSLLSSNLTNDTQSTVQSPKNTAESKDGGKNDELLRATMIENAKLNIKIMELEEKLKKAQSKNNEYESTIEYQRAVMTSQESDLIQKNEEIEKLTTCIGKKDWVKAVEDSQVLEMELV